MNCTGFNCRHDCFTTSLDNRGESYSERGRERIKLKANFHPGQNNWADHILFFLISKAFHRSMNNNVAASQLSSSQTQG